MHRFDEQRELGLTSIQKHLNWKQEILEKRGRELMKRGIIYVDREKKLYRLTQKGIEKYELIKSEYGM